jgi:hypothetical protein
MFELFVVVFGLIHDLLNIPIGTHAVREFFDTGCWAVAMLTFSTLATTRRT